MAASLSALVEDHDVSPHFGGYGFSRDPVEDVYLTVSTEVPYNVGKFAGVARYVLVASCYIKVVDGLFSAKNKLAIGPSNIEEEVAGSMIAALPPAEDTSKGNGGSHLKIVDR